MKATEWASHIDRNQTAKNAKSELQQYFTMRRLARRSAYMATPKISDIPRSPQTNNHVEDHMIEQLNAQQWIDNLNGVLEDMQASNERYAKIIKLCYLQGLDNSQAMERLGVSESTFTANKRDALVAFAEAWPPFPSELLAYN